MYIRKVNKKDRATGEMYTTYRLVEGYRNERGEVRQQVLLHLGANFAVPFEDWKTLSDRIESILSGQEYLFGLSDTKLEQEAQHLASLIVKRQVIVAKANPKNGTAKKDTTKEFEAVDLKSIKHSDIRPIGAEHVGYHAAQQLGLPDILASCGLTGKQLTTALGSIIGRLCAPASELSTYNYLQNDSGLDELLSTSFASMTLRSLYTISDILLKHKDVLESGLYKQEKELFDLPEVITLFDITNTYFEGRSLANPKAKYGRSKEKRSDCKLVALGLVLDGSGFPKMSRIFPGNVGEPGTLQEMLTTLSNKTDATIIMDAGIATQDNIKYLAENRYKYIVVSRSHNLSMPDGQVVNVKQDSGNQVDAVLIENTETNEMELYCHSEAKENKAKELVNKTTQRYETELIKLNAGLSKPRATKKYAKVLQKLGRLAEKYKSIAMLYNIEVVADTEKTNVLEVKFGKKLDAIHKKECGIYCLKSNRKDLDAKSLWETYTMLTDLEAAFKSLKTELGLRPVYHQKEERVDGHLFISILAYHLLHTIRYQLKQHGINDSWDTLRTILNRQYRVTSTMQMQDNKTVIIRKTSQPTAEQIEIYKALGISSLPGKIIKTYV
jgi:transposase